MEIGAARFLVERACTRCSTVIVDQGSGEVEPSNWLSSVLAKYRLIRKEHAFDTTGTKFGVYLTPINSGVIQCQDKIRVIRRKSDVAQQ